MPLMGVAHKREVEEVGMLERGSEFRAADVMRDDGDSNGKGRGALRKVWFVGLLAISATILVGVVTKENGETLMEWGSDVAEASVASIAGLGSYVGKGPTAARDNDENTEGRMREAGGDAEGSIARTSVQGGPASEATTADTCPRCVKRAQMHLNRALASGETFMGSKDKQDHRKE